MAASQSELGAEHWVMKMSQYPYVHHCEERSDEAIFVMESSQRSQTWIATPREARLAMTLFPFSDPDARSRNPESLFLHSDTIFRPYPLVPGPLYLLHLSLNQQQRKQRKSDHRGCRHVHADERHHEEARGNGTEAAAEEIGRVKRRDRLFLVRCPPGGLHRQRRPPRESPPRRAGPPFRQVPRIGRFGPGRRQGFRGA